MSVSVARAAHSRPARPRTRTADEPAPAIVATATALPKHRYTQDDLALLAERILPEATRLGAPVERIFERAGVGERYFALPADAYADLGGLGQRNGTWLEVALDLGERAIRSVLEDANVDAGEIAMLMTTTVTGLAVPSLDARLMNRLPFAIDLKRVPLFGLGCLGGAAGLARASEYLRAFPDELAIVLSVELCSLTFRPEDLSMPNLVSSGLFGDGASAVLLAGTRHPLAKRGQRVVASSSVFFPHTERMMGWDVGDYGFKVVLSADVPAVVRENLPRAVGAFLERYGLKRDDVASWIVHPGGPKLIDAVEESLGLDPSELEPTRDGLVRFGNLSSSSVLFLLDEHRRVHVRERGRHAVVMAMGPAFCAELVLLQW